MLGLVGVIQLGGYYVHLFLVIALVLFFVYLLLKCCGGCVGLSKRARG